MKLQTAKVNDVAEVLIVEDSPTQAERLKHILERHDYEVSVASNGRAALDSLDQRKPHIIISDIMMPEMDGYELCRRIKGHQDFREIPVILLTSLSDPVDVVKGLECGADNFITKPYDEKYLLSRIQYILINRELYKSEKMQMGVEIFFAGRKYFITSERQQILNLLLSTYETAVQKNLELIKTQEELKSLNDRLEEIVEERTANLKLEIAERKRAEEALKLHSRVLESMAEGVNVADQKGLTIYTNPACDAMFGYERGELISQHTSILHAQSREDTARTIGEVMESAKTEAGWSGEFNNRKKDGTAFITHATMSVLEVGDKRHWISVQEDITERKQAEEALRQSEEQLRQSQKMEAVGRLAGGVAHDFNNLLTAIIGYSDMLLEQLEEKNPLAGDVHEIRKAGERAATLTNQLLAFRRRQVLQPRVLDLNDVVTDMEKMRRRLIGEDIELVTHPDPGLGRVKADPGGIEQVIMNLAVNARDAMPDGGKLTIETSNVELDESYSRNHIAIRPGPFVMLAVTDNGIGMTSETQSRIFEPFFTTKEKGKGTGLGLSTIYGIVKQSGGNIWVYSELGKGTTFKIYLPRVEEAVTPVQTARPKSEVSEGSETILLVEDEEVIRKLVHSILQDHGYTVLEASQGSEALRISEQYQGPIHMMLTDVVMPQMSVRMLTENLAKMRPEAKVLYVSGYTDDTIVHHGVLDEGMNFIQKPFTVSALTKKVREVLDQP